jgi:hypothetical protein
MGERHAFLPDSTVTGFPLGCVRALAKYAEKRLLDEMVEEEEIEAVMATLDWLAHHHLYALEILDREPLPWSGGKG